MTDQTSSPWIERTKYDYSLTQRDPYYGGATYTVGQGIVSLRIDDWKSGDVSYIIPELDSRGLMVGFGIPAAKMGTLYWATLADALSAQTTGHEIMCHSMNHGTDPVTDEELIEETVNAANYLRQRGLLIDSWCLPGTWVGEYRIDTTAFWGSKIDVLLRTYFPCYFAYIWLFTSGFERDLPVPPAYRFGTSVCSAYNRTLAELKTIVDNCIANGQGTHWVFHYNNIGAEISQADFEEILDYIEAKKAAGDIKVMTPTQQLFAQPA